MISGTKRTFIRGGMLLQQAITLSLDTVFLAGKLTTRIPSYITKSALFGLSCTSILSAPFQCSLLNKVSVDLIHGRASHERAVMLASALKVIYISSGLLLSGTNIIAAAAGLGGKEDLQTQVYKAMIPLGECSIALALLLDIIDLYFYRKILGKNCPSPESFELALIRLPPSSLDKSDMVFENVQQLASQLRYCMDKDTLTDLIKNFKTENSKKLTELTLKNIETQQNIALGGGVLLSLIGYTLMAVEKYYTPNSIQSAIINESMAVLYAAQTGFQLFREVNQRIAIKSTQEPLLVPSDLT